MAQPTKLPEWATVGGDITEPTTAQKQKGWTAAGGTADIPPNGWVNWWWNLVYLWIQHIGAAASSFATLEDAVAGTSIGDTCIVDEHDLSRQPGALKIGVASANGMGSISVSGKSVAYTQQTADTFHLVQRDDLTTVIATLTKSNAGTVRRVITDGKHVVGIYGQFIEVWLHDTGASLWSEDHGAVIADVAMDGTNVYFCGNAAAGPIHARARVTKDGVVVWNYNHGANLGAIATNGRQVFISGLAGTGGFHMRALDAANGFDAGASSTDLAWNLNRAGSPTNTQQIVTDGSTLYISMDSGANGIEVRATVDGTLIGSALQPIALGTPLAVDGRYLIAARYLGGGTHRVLALDKRTLSLAWLSTLVTQANSVATDGSAVFVAAAVASANELARLYRGNRARIWRRVEVGDDYLPYRQLIIPEE